MKNHINANQIKMAYQIDGPENGPTVIMSNSLMSSLEMWDSNISALTDRYRVIRYDTRGHGQTQVTEGPYSIALLAQDLVALMDALQIKQAHLVGLSMGGIYLACASAVRDMAQSTMLLKIKAPTMVLVGKQDPACTVDQATVLHRLIPQSSMVVLDQAAHLANIEQPQAFNTALRGFLDSVA